MKLFEGLDFTGFNAEEIREMSLWRYDGFGMETPENWEEIVDAVNAEIISHSILEQSTMEGGATSDKMWEDFWENDEICGIKAIWKEEDDE